MVNAAMKITIQEQLGQFVVLQTIVGLVQLRDDAVLKLPQVKVILQSMYLNFSKRLKSNKTIAS